MSQIEILDRLPTSNDLASEDLTDQVSKIYFVNQQRYRTIYVMGQFILRVSEGKKF